MYSWKIVHWTYGNIIGELEHCQRHMSSHFKCKLISIKSTIYTLKIYIILYTWDGQKISNVSLNNKQMCAVKTKLHNCKLHSSSLLLLTYSSFSLNNLASKFLHFLFLFGAASPLLTASIDVSSDDFWSFRHLINVHSDGCLTETVLFHIRW